MLGLERHRLVIATETRRARVDDDLAPIRRARELMTVLRILLAILYLACRVYSGPATLRGGHLWLFWIGSLFPLLPRKMGLGEVLDLRFANSMFEPIWNRNYGSNGGVPGLQSRRSFPVTHVGINIGW